jgi:hypothetical protein
VRADLFGKSVALSASGDALAVGAVGEDSGAVGVAAPRVRRACSQSTAAVRLLAAGERRIELR